MQSLHSDTIAVWRQGVAALDFCVRRSGFGRTANRFARPNGSAWYVRCFALTLQRLIVVLLIEFVFGLPLADATTALPQSAPAGMSSADWSKAKLLESQAAQLDKDGDWKAAGLALQKLITLLEKSLGKSNALALAVLEIQIALFEDWSEDGAASASRVKLVESLTSRFGASDERALRALKALGALYSRNEKYAYASDVYRHILTNVGNSSESSKEFAIEVLSDLVVSLQSDDKLLEAESEARRLVTGASERYGPRSWHVGEARTLLVSVLLDAHKTKEAFDEYLLVDQTSFDIDDTLYEALFEIDRIGTVNKTYDTNLRAVTLDATRLGGFDSAKVLDLFERAKGTGLWGTQVQRLDFWLNAQDAGGLEKADRERLSGIAAVLSMLEADRIAAETTLTGDRLDVEVRKFDLKKRQLREDNEKWVSDLGRRISKLASPKELVLHFDDWHVQRNLSIMAARSGTADPLDACKVLPKDSAYISYLLDRRSISVTTPIGAVLVVYQEGNNCLAVIRQLPAVRRFQDTVGTFAAILSEPRGVEDLTAKGKKLVRRANGSIGVVRNDYRAFFDASDAQPATEDEVRAQLHAVLIEPILDLVKNKRLWVISPDRTIAQVPFDALRIDGREILLDHSVMYAFAVRNLQTSANLYKIYDLDGWERELFAVGAPIYEAPRKVTDQVQTPSSERDLKEGQVDISQMEWTSLPGSEREVRQASAAFAGHGAGSTEIFAQSDAVKSRLLGAGRSRYLEQFKYVLFATHGYWDARRLSQSSIVLGLEGKGRMDDRLLLASDIFRFSLRSALVLFSGCNTGRGDWEAGEGLKGLAYAAFAAGAANVALSLLPVDDQAQVSLMSLIFQNLSDSKSPVDAIVRAKRQILVDPNFAHLRAPYYWAGLVLYGAPEKALH